MTNTPVELIASTLFFVAIIHTFSTPFFAKLAHKNRIHAGLWHLLAEIETVFGVWALVLILIWFAFYGSEQPVNYLETRHFVEPLFVFAIMVIAASRPILQAVTQTIAGLAATLPVARTVSTYFLTLTLIPLLGSLITEPAAMTLAAVMLRDTVFRQIKDLRFKYLTLGLLFVNISVGGVLTSYAAPPVLMVAKAFGWDSLFMFTEFGWRATLTVLLNTTITLLLFRRTLLAHPVTEPPKRAKIPWFVTAIHFGFLIAVVMFNHHPAVFLGLLLFFLGFTEAYKQYQDKLLLREALMVAFFLAGLVTLGGLQQWWLQDLLASLSPSVLFWGVTALTAFTDNAALTYLGSLVEGTNEAWRYALVAGAITGGGLTVIANAPNPAGYSILKASFPSGNIDPRGLLLGALGPTAIAALMFLFP